MGITQGSKNKKDLNVELNLLPVFDVLSVCICFLLMTVVWVEVRALETRQAMGSQSVAETEKQASVWMSIDERSNVIVTLKPVKGAESRTLVQGRGGKIDLEKAKQILTSAYSKNVRASHIMPAKNTKYDQVIQLMDVSKQVGIHNIGLSPI